MFRIKVASTAANLSNPGCAFTASTLITVLTSTCSVLPAPKLITFRAKQVNGYGNLDFTTDQEVPGIHFEIEKSTDAVHYQQVGTVNASAPEGEGKNYSFADAAALTGATYYRVKLVTAKAYTYSHIAVVYPGSSSFEIKSILNPFDSYISFDVVSPSDRQASISLFDSFGRMVKQQQLFMYNGFNKITIPDLNTLGNGNYILQIETGGQTFNKKLIKIKH
jgi:hypothetical protein